jgi:hypothetical protein
MTGNKALMREIKAAQPQWFSRGNKRFFHDVQYAAYYGKATGNRYMVRSTYAWTDMFGNAPRLHYRINRIGENHEIQPLVDGEFKTWESVQQWLRLN